MAATDGMNFNLENLLCSKHHCSVFRSVILSQRLQSSPPVSQWAHHDPAVLSSVAPPAHHTVWVSHSLSNSHGPWW